jgi:hypothetical protein
MTCLRTLTWSLGIVALLGLACGLAVSAPDTIPEAPRVALEKAGQIELYSLDPSRSDEKPKDDFHGWKVLGKTTVKSADTLKTLVAALKKGVAENEGIVAGCFNPRHGIRVTHDGKTVDFVICFECYQVAVYVDGKREKGFLVTRSPQPAFDKVLKDVGVPLAKKAE